MVTRGSLLVSFEVNQEQTEIRRVPRLNLFEIKGQLAAAPIKVKYKTREADGHLQYAGEIQDTLYRLVGGVEKRIYIHIFNS